jgi:hypothetical protein
VGFKGGGAPPCGANIVFLGKHLINMEVSPGLLTPEEYERRKLFLDQLKGLTKSEYIEIVRLLQKHEASFSENLNGVFFNVCVLTQPVFDALELFIQFTQSNRKNLADRDSFLSTLTTEVPKPAAE